MPKPISVRPAAVPSLRPNDAVIEVKPTALQIATWGNPVQSPESTFETAPVVAEKPSKAELAKPALDLISRKDRGALEALIATAKGNGTLGPMFEGIIEAGQYEKLQKTLGRKSNALKALAEVRPTYNEAELNAATEAQIAAHPEWKSQFAYDATIIPGFTPIDANEPMPLERLPIAEKRLDVAVEDFKSGKVPLLLVSGGNVHPSGTPYNEGLMMRQYLIDHGVPADRILLDAHARHSTTNLRNAGRLMAKNGLDRGLIATGFDRGTFNQHFYFSHPVMSTFHLRCVNTLGYEVGKLKNVDEHHVSFKPSSKCDRQHWADPLDP